MMSRVADILLRIALAVPMGYLVYQTHHYLGVGIGFGPSFVFFGGPHWWGVALGLPVLGILFGCVVVVSGWRARWPWAVVAASSLWFAFGWKSALSGHLAYPWQPWGYSKDLVAMDAYTLLLAIGLLLGAGSVVKHGRVAPSPPRRVA